MTSDYLRSKVLFFLTATDDLLAEDVFKQTSVFIDRLVSSLVRVLNPHWFRTIEHLPGTILGLPLLIKHNLHRLSTGVTE